MAEDLGTIGVIGLGYVGLPLAVAFAQAGCDVIAVDVDARKIEAIEASESYIEDVSSDTLRGVAARIHATTRYSRLAKANAVLVCVPTPLTPNREPDLGPLIDSTRALAEGAAGRPARCPRVHDVSWHDARACGTAAGGVWAGGRQGISPGILARARGPGANRFHVAQHTEGPRRVDRRVCRPCGVAVSAGVRRGSASRAPRPPSSRSSWRTSSDRSTSPS